MSPPVRPAWSDRRRWVDIQEAIATSQRIRARVHHERMGSAIAMVVVFLGFVAIVALATSFQSGGLRRMVIRSHVGFEAVEICDSAVNEAWAQVGIKDLFPESVFTVGSDSYMKHLCVNVGDEKIDELKKAYPGYEFQTRIVYNGVPPSGTPLPPPDNRIFVCMKWPKEYTKTYKVPQSAAVAATVSGFKGPLPDVKMRPLTWRRDFAGNTWQNWGVARLEATASLEDRGTTVTRTMYVDRMFTLPTSWAVGTYPNLVAVESKPADPATLWIQFRKSTRNLKTVIKRS